MVFNDIYCRIKKRAGLGGKSYSAKLTIQLSIFNRLYRRSHRAYRLVGRILDQFNNEKTIRFLKSDRAWLTLTFDNCKQGLKKIFEPLKLTIDY